MPKSTSVFYQFPVLLLLILHASWVASAPVYKSKDAEGNVTYSSEPPPEAEQVQEVAVPKSPPSGAESNESSIDEIKQKADALGRENAAREKEIQNQKQQQETKQVVSEEPPVQTHRPVIQNRPINKPPAGVTPPVVKPQPKGGAN